MGGGFKGEVKTGLKQRCSVCEQKDSQQRERGGVGDIAMTHRAREKEREGGR